MMDKNISYEGSQDHLLIEERDDDDVNVTFDQANKYKSITATKELTVDDDILAMNPPVKVKPTKKQS